MLEDKKVDTIFVMAGTSLAVSVEKELIRKLSSQQAHEIHQRSKQPLLALSRPFSYFLRIFNLAANLKCA